MSKKKIKQAIEYFYTKMERGLIEDDKQQEIYEISIDALNKQVPMKLKGISETYNGEKVGTCKCGCNHFELEHEYYCSNCGQKLKWD